jgi:hypothetical protein
VGFFGDELMDNVEEGRVGDVVTLRTRRRGSPFVLVRVCVWHGFEGPV